MYNDVFPPVAGGIEKHIDLIRRALPDVRSDVLVCARGRHGRCQPYGTGVEVHVAELGPRVWSVPIAPAFPFSLRRMQADVIHLHMPNPLGELGVLIDRKRPVVCTYHADVVRQARVTAIYRPLVHACLGRAAEIIVDHSPDEERYDREVLRWLEKGKIPAHRVGKQWRFKPSEVDEWVKSGNASEDAAEKVDTNA